MEEKNYWFNLSFFSMFRVDNIPKTFLKKEAFAVRLTLMEGPKSLQLQLMVITGKSVLNV